MAQIVILAPADVDVSSAIQALQDAGHEAESVEPTAINLMHMAVGMLEDSELEVPAEAPSEEAPAEEATDEAPPEDTEEPAEEEKTTEGLEPLGAVDADGVVMPAYLDRSSAFPLLYSVGQHLNGRLSFSLGESTYAVFADSPSVFLDINKVPSKVEVKRGASNFMVLDSTTARSVGVL